MEEKEEEEEESAELREEVTLTKMTQALVF